MQSLSNHQYIQKIIWNLIAGGKVSKLESEEIERAMLSFSQSDWRNFKITGKKAINELVEREINKFKIPEQWKTQFKMLSRAVVNFSLALFSEEFITEAIQCKKSKIPVAQRLDRLLPLVIKQMRTMAARKPASTTVNYRTEKSFNNKGEEAKLLAMSFYASRSEQEAITKIKKIISIIKSLTPDEIKIAKGKGKDILWWLLDRYAPPKLVADPLLKDGIQAVINLADAVQDETLMSEILKMTIEMLEIFYEKVNLSSAPTNFHDAVKWGATSFLEMDQVMTEGIRSRGWESRCLKLAQNFTQHLNQLAGTEGDDQISTSEEQELARKLAPAKTAGENNNSEEETAGNFISPVGLLSGLENLGTPSHPLTSGEWWNIGKKIDKELTSITLTTPTWYERPWLVVLLIVGALAIGGLISWLIFRSKARPIPEKEDY